MVGLGRSLTHQRSDKSLLVAAHMMSADVSFAKCQTAQRYGSRRTVGAHMISTTIPRLITGTHLMYCNTLQHTAKHCNTLQHMISTTIPSVITYHM